jgi:hypothetical protein
VQVESPQLTFPAAFCCNCGALECAMEVQDTRVSRFFGVYRTETVFRLSLPICAGCRKTMRRAPAGFFVRMAVLVAAAAAWCLVLHLLGTSVTLPAWFLRHQYTVGVALGAITAFFFYRLRRPRPPRTSFYQPVRIRQADVRFAGVMGGPGEVVYLKLAFTNPEYLNTFLDANRDAVRAGRLAIVQA